MNADLIVSVIIIIELNHAYKHSTVIAVHMTRYILSDNCCEYFMEILLYFLPSLKIHSMLSIGACYFGLQVSKKYYIFIRHNLMTVRTIKLDYLMWDRHSCPSCNKES